MTISSKVYHISPIYLRNLRIEVSGGRRMRRERDNAYDGKEEVQGWTREQKEERYDTLKESIFLTTLRLMERPLSLALPCR